MEAVKSSTIVSTITLIIGVLWVTAHTAAVKKSSGDIIWNDNPNGLMNAHMVIMAVGMFFLMGAGLIPYKLLAKTKRRNIKWVHLIITSVSFFLTLVGFIAAFLSRDKSMYAKHVISLHSWLGIILLLTFFLECVLGVVVFLFKIKDKNYRAYFAGYHSAFGVLTFIVAFLVVTSGVYSFQSYCMVKNPLSETWQHNLAALLSLMYFVGIVLVLLLYQ